MQQAPIAFGKINLSGERIEMGGLPIPSDKVDMSLLGRAVDERMLGELRYVGRGITLAFEHLDVVLAFTARNGTKPGAGRVTASVDVALANDGDDPVIARLSDALKTAETMEGTDAGIQADALRLAIVTRMMGRRFKFGWPPKESDEVKGGKRARRALQSWRLRRVVEYIDVHLTGKISLQDIAAAAGLSRMHFASQFRIATGMRPHDYLLRRRIRRAEDLLSRTNLSLVEIALTVGFRTQAHFTSVFKRFIGDTPYQWRSANRMNGSVCK